MLGVVGRQAVLALEALGHRLRQLGHLAFHPLHPLGRDHQRRQVGVGEVAVVVRVFLGAHGTRLAGVGVEQHGGLLDRAAVFERVDLPVDLVVDRLLQEAEAVQVLDLAARAEGIARLAHRHVGVAAEAAFLHVAVADAQPHHQRMEGARIFDRLDAGAHVGLGDDLQQRRAGAVEVDAGEAVIVLVQRLAGVFLEVGARQAHRVRRVTHVERNQCRPAPPGSRTG